jgi:hypothetical protein
VVATPQKISVITTSLQFWQANTCVTFTLNATGSNSLLFFNGSGCWSYVGQIGGQQQVSIGDGCQYVGVINILY